LRVVDVFRRVLGAIRRQLSLSPEQVRLLHDLRRCRTAALGGQVLACPRCGQQKECFHSCRNRHCPNCQAEACSLWIARRSEQLLPVPHFHAVFTCPDALRSLCKQFPGPMFTLLMSSAADVLKGLAQEEIGVQLGITQVLHTWTRELDFHPHVHCIVTAGGWDSRAGRWVAPRRSRFLFAVARMRARFRARILAGLAGLLQQGAVTLPQGITLAEIHRALPPVRQWVVYIKAPFGKVGHVLAYLGRYTHRVGITDSRLLAVDERTVTFRTRGDSRCTLTQFEFLRRFLMHVLPSGWKKIRHYGLYAPNSKDRERARAVLAQRAAPDASNQDERPEPTGDERSCPDCHIPMQVVAEFPRPWQCRPWRPP
jgi:hypothetical protein